ncbi:MAG TPA: hypothetical protein VEI95_04325 [Acidobacteriota bacterium]|nr:hypothetical protein [Acidobacteriota bacterium]
MAAPAQHYFDFTCRARHSKGEFAYTGRDICFDPQAFRDFAKQLDAIRNGKAQRAGFHDVGEMLRFSIEIHGRETAASVRIREYQPNGQETLLSASFRVDYDLFVNALYAKILVFSEALEGAELA